MRAKELKNIAKKIAKCEKLMADHPDDEKIINQAKDQIIQLSGQLKSLDDMMWVDEYVQEILKNS